MSIDSNTLGALHGKKPSDIYVILSADKSTVLRDPGMDRPWSSPNRKLAEFHAKKYNGIVANIPDAIQCIIHHPKNQPGWVRKEAGLRRLLRPQSPDSTTET